MGFCLTLARNVSRPIIPWRQAIALRCGLLEGIWWAGCVQALGRWITRTAPHRWIVGRSARGDPIGCLQLLAHHWLREKNSGVGPKRKPSSSWAVESRRFFVNVLALVFLHRLKLHNNWHCVENLVLFVLYKCKMTKFIRAKFIFIMQNGHKLLKKGHFAFCICSHNIGSDHGFPRVQLASFSSSFQTTVSHVCTLPMLWWVWQMGY